MAGDCQAGKRTALKARAQKFELNLTGEDQYIVDQTLKTGNLKLFSEFFFRLPNGGSRWMPGDSLGHYRHLFEYDMLYSAWKTAGKPDENLSITTPDYQDGLRVSWEGDTLIFLLPHGYLFLDWSLPVIDCKTNVALVETGTGTSKTSSVAVAALITCALFPDYNFLNAAPTDEQSNLMIAEMEKWITSTPFTKFVIPTTRGELYVQKPSATVEIASPFDPRYPSHFVWLECQQRPGQVYRLDQSGRNPVDGSRR